MVNQIENQSSRANSTRSWDQSGAAELARVLAVIINGQKGYGKELSLKDTLAYYRMKLEGRFTANQVIHALGLYTDRKNDIPAPADIINILDPIRDERITTAEFLHAKEQWALEGFPACSYYGRMVKDYEKQGAEDRVKSLPITDERVLSIVHSAVKKVGKA